MKTEPIPVIVTEPGKGYPYEDMPEFGEYDDNKDVLAYQDFELFDLKPWLKANTRPAIDTKGNALPVGEYLCREVIIAFIDRLPSEKIVIDKSHVDAYTKQNGWTVETAYQLIEDEVKGEKEPLTAEEYLNLYGAPDGTYTEPKSKEGFGNVGKKHNPQDLKSVAILNEMLAYAGKYEISIQFWGEGNTNVFIAKDGVDLHDFGGLNPQQAIEETVKYLNRINRK